ARFRILSSAQLNELERAKQLYANSRLTLGVLYARMGLRDEAAAEFRTLLNSNPGSLVLEQLLHSVTHRPK
ncbi:MAG TPA: hypothetical protein VJ302_27555, partial [Blastocatellia bacterium]|nr:hypothetical protein [Blastocatellia bacterium]